MLGALPPSSRVARCCLEDHLANLSGPGKSDLINSRMSGKRCACTASKVRDDVDDASGESCFHNQLAKPQGGKWRLLRWFEDRGTADCKCRSELPCGHQQWEVPGNDLSDHANGFAQGVSEVLTGEGHGDGIAFNLRCPPCHIAKHINGKRDVGSASNR